MKRAVLFRFHKSFDVCQNRIEQLRRFNPDIVVLPLYGGSKDDLGQAENFCQKLGLKPFYEVKSEDPNWKWKNGDVQIQQWFADVGRHLKFDFLHLIEWDVLLFESLENLYGQLPNGVVLTGLCPLKDVQDKWSWLVDKPSRSEWLRLMAMIKEKYGYDQEPYACLFPAGAFSRSFLDGLSEIEIPNLVNDEVRLPLWAQILGEPLHDTGFYPEWFSPKVYSYFNCRGLEIDESLIREELAKGPGRRVFHPFTQIFAVEPFARKVPQRRSFG